MKWCASPMHELAEINPRRPRELNQLPDEHLVTFVPMPAVCASSGTIATPDIRPYKDVKKGFTYFAENDIIFAKITPCMQNGKSAIACGLTNKLGFGSTEFHVIRADQSKVIPEWLHYFVRQLSYRNEGTHHFRGAVGQQRVPPEYLAEAIVPHPESVDEQRRIVARIKECISRVEEIEVNQKAVEEDYSALKYSLVAALLEDPCADNIAISVGELVSGIPDAMRSGPFGSAMKHEEFVADGHLVVGIANVQKNRFDPIRKWMISDSKYEEMKRYQIAPGDVLITIMGTIGRTCVVPKGLGRAITSKHVYRIRFPKTVNPYFISYLINFGKNVRSQLYGTAAGGVMPGLNSTKLRNLVLRLPSRDVQDSMVEKLDEASMALEDRAKLASNADVVRLREAILRKAFAGEL